MLIVEVQGGLGNQISQYAFSRWLLSRYPREEIKIDILKYERGLSPFPYGLEAAFLPGSLVFATATAADVFKIARKKYPKSELAGKIFGRLTRYGETIRRKNYSYVQAPQSRYPMDSWWPDVDSDISNRKSCYFSGYWQNYDYLDILPRLRQELVFREIDTRENQRMLQKIKSTNAVSVHVRMGDYVGSIFDVLTQTYYENAVRTMLERMPKDREPCFFVFSDDSVKAGNLFREMQVPYELVDINHGADSYYDMRLMSLCKYNIIANSTFSYWAAYLNDNPEKIVIRPRMQTVDRETWEVPGWIILDL